MAIWSAESEELDAGFGDESCWAGGVGHAAYVCVCDGVGGAYEVLCCLVNSSQWCLEHECEEEK